jgi:acyl dehydratase
MALDPAKIGFSYPPMPPYAVGREKIGEFATAIGATDPIHFDPAVAAAFGYPDVIAPATFPIVLAEPAIKLMIDDPDLGLDFNRVVHGDQKFAYHRPVRAGDVLICVTTITDITERAGAGFVTTTSEIATPTGERVATATSRLVVRVSEDDAS